jgi:replicative superfamily II helicase
MASFLAEEAEAQTRILVALRVRLENGAAAADPKATKSPSREWVRAARLYFDGYRHLAQLQLEHAKIRLLAERVHGKAPMTDTEYEAQLEALGQDALDTQSAEALEAALERKRALAVPANPGGHAA